MNKANMKTNPSNLETKTYYSQLKSDLKKLGV